MRDLEDLSAKEKGGIRGQGEATRTYNKDDMLRMLQAFRNNMQFWDEVWRRVCASSMCVSACTQGLRCCSAYRNSMQFGMNHLPLSVCVYVRVLYRDAGIWE
jgi:hypothetical protein